MHRHGFWSARAPKSVTMHVKEQLALQVRWAYRRL